MQRRKENFVAAIEVRRYDRNPQNPFGENPGSNAIINSYGLTRFQTKENE
jgi:hypothetical protein